MPELTAAQRRLKKFLIDIKDEDIRDLIIEVIGIEVSNRSTQRFPNHEIREKVDGVARVQEMRLDKESK